MTAVLVDTHVALWGVLIAHALHDDLDVMTRDGAFASYGVRLAAPATAD